MLFLSYALDAYVPGAGGARGLRTWEPLRDATETALLEQRARRACDVIVKCHPQQDRRAEAARLARLAGSALDAQAVSLADQDADTRELILDADVVVGFQTTALYEAVAARRTVIYAAWGDEYERHRDGLIPFDDRAARTACVHATSAEMLADDAHRRRHPGERLAAASRGTKTALGTIDGHATDRVARAIRDVAPERGAQPTPPRARGASAALRDRPTRAIGRRRTLWTSRPPVADIAGEQRRVSRQTTARSGGPAIGCRLPCGVTGASAGPDQCVAFSTLLVGPFAPVQNASCRRIRSPRASPRDTRRPFRYAARRGRGAPLAMSWAIGLAPTR